MSINYNISKVSKLTNNFSNKFVFTRGAFATFAGDCDCFGLCSGDYRGCWWSEAASVGSSFGHRQSTPRYIFVYIIVEH